MNAKDKEETRTCVFCGREETDPYFCWGCGAYKVTEETRDLPLSKQPYFLPSMEYASKKMKRMKKNGTRRKADKKAGMATDKSNGSKG